MNTHPAYAATLTDDNSEVTLEVTAPDGRVLLVTVTLNTQDPDADPVVHDGSLVVYLDPDTWEPTPDLLRVNVGDGGIFGYEEVG